MSTAYADHYYRKRAKKLRRTAPPICFFCGEAIDNTLDRYHPMGWTAHHVDPLGTGGKLYGRLEPAHRRCNAAYGDGTRRQERTAYPTSRKW